MQRYLWQWRQTNLWSHSRAKRYEMHKEWSMRSHRVFIHNQMVTSSWVTKLQLFSIDTRKSSSRLISMSSDLRTDWKRCLRYGLRRFQCSCVISWSQSQRTTSNTRPHQSRNLLTIKSKPVPHRNHSQSWSWWGRILHQWLISSHALKQRRRSSGF